MSPPGGVFAIRDTNERASEWSRYIHTLVGALRILFVANFLISFCLSHRHGLIPPHVQFFLLLPLLAPPRSPIPSLPFCYSSKAVIFLFFISYYSFFTFISIFYIFPYFPYNLLFTFIIFSLIYFS